RQQGTVTVGVRGLAAEDLAAARPDQAELEKMESYRASRDQAYQFASRGRLSAQTVDYLPAPSATFTSQPSGSGGGRD
ncbi:MAG: SH3 domain-containing protein, partial [Gammaproteobacteria bacterium]|nr:SH3 domain-containing protein [Gammaproteobacteria bacterium]